MPSFNKVILMGNLTREPEIKYTPKGTAICDIGLAINRVWVNDAGQKMEDVTFVDVTLWGRTGEVVGEYCRKGDPLHVEGHLQLDQWDDKQTGQKRSKLKVVGEHIQLIAQKREGDGGQGGGERRAGPPQRPPSGSGRPSGPPQRPAGRPAPPRDPDLDPPEDDIPF